jgi:Cu2+-exporting ATPase
LAYKVNAIVLDKTGTITVGRPQVTDMIFVNESEIPQLKSVLLSIERQSEHPLAQAVVSYLEAEGVPYVPVDQIESITGKGVIAYYSGKEYIVGNQKLLSDHHIQWSFEVDKQIKALQEKAKTVVLLAEDQKLSAIIAIADKIKPTSREAIASLKDRGIEVHMLTGDNLQTAEAIAQEIGLEHFKAEVLPSEKAAFIKHLQQKGKIVAMVGDGINDSQALAQADVSIAMGKGSDIAMDVAKMTLITSDLNSVPNALKLSGKTVKTIRQNLFWAFIYNVIGIPLAAGVLYPFNGFLLNPMIAGAAMALSSVSVVVNSLRLKWMKL